MMKKQSFMKVAEDSFIIAMLGKPKDIGYDKNWQVYRHILRGEKTRGLIIQNPKKISQSILNKLRVMI